jgi:hypothetical protein
MAAVSISVARFDTIPRPRCHTWDAPVSYDGPVIDVHTHVTQIELPPSRPSIGNRVDGKLPPRQ